MKVLFTTQPASGHFHPLVPFARELVAAGHEVAIATSRSFCPTVEALGFRAIPVGLDWLESEPAVAFPEFKDVHPEEHTWFFFSIFFDKGLRAMLPDLLEAAASWRPDVIVREYWEPAGGFAAERLGIPSATAGIGLFFPPQMFRDYFGQTIDELRSQYDLPPDPGAERLFGDLFLNILPPRYQSSEVKLPPNTEHIRPCVFDNIGDATLPEWVHSLADRPTVYASLGTVLNQATGVFERILEGLRDEPINLILTVGRNGDPARFGPQPENVRIEQFIPQSLLFPHCDVVVTHGGYNTVMAALSAGLPMLILPMGTDDPFHAQCCAELGVAKPLFPVDATADAIRSAVSEVLGNPSYRERAASMRRAIEAQPGPGRVVELLSQLARSRESAS